MATVIYRQVFFLNRNHLIYSCGIILVLLSIFAQAEESIYIWVDDHGVKHFDQQNNANQTAVKHDFDYSYRIDWIPDGDTIHLKNGWKIRLIGINTPEISKRGRAGQQGGEAARQFLVKRLHNKKVRLEFDAERFDRYGRRLAYVFVGRENINAEIIRKGLGHVNAVPPNIQHIRHFLSLEKEARAANRGIWKLPKYRLKQIGKDVIQSGFHRVRGTVHEVRLGHKYAYLDFGANFIARIEKKYLADIVNGMKHPNDLVHTTLLLRGWVKKKKKQWVLYIKHPLQVSQWGH